MDLFEYEDVAQSYEQWTDPSPKDMIDFHLEMAGKYGNGGILDIACGTGVEALPLLTAGYTITALDLSEPMLKILKAKVAELPENKRSRCEVVESDMRDFELKNNYSLAFITRGGFIHLTTSKDQRQTLLNVHRHLKPKGVLVFTTFDPNYEMIFSGLKGKPVEPFLRYTYTNSKGNQEKVYNLPVHDPATQIVEVLWTWEETNPKGEVVSKRDRLLRCRWTFRQETEYLLELTGFKVLALYGGFSKEAPVPGGKTNLWVCEKK